MRNRTTTCRALIIKQSKVGETDRVITLISQEHGKIAVVAKGVRKLKSSKRAFLEPGNIVKAHLIITKGMPLLTQASLISDCMLIRSDLNKIRQLHQVLEIIDKLLVEEELEFELFELCLNLRSEVVVAGKTKTSINAKLQQLLVVLGFQPLQETKYQNVLEYVSALTNRPMRSWDFLSV